MKYPNHTLLDLSSSPSVSSLSSWKRCYTDPNVGIPLVNPNHCPIALTRVQTHGTARTTGRSYQASSQILTPLFDVNFIRKEKLYTKLKYSRCPQYDIVSGGFAALLAGFVGFLISEKFGIELVDSGDFYIAFMYGVFAAFSLRPLILSYSKYDTPYTPVSLKYLLLFVTDLTTLFLRLVLSQILKLLP